MQEIFLGAGRILGGELDVVDVRARQGHVLVHRFQHLLAAHAQLVFAMQRTGGQEQVQARTGGGLHGTQRGLDIGGQAARQHRQGGVAQFAGDQRMRLAVRLRTGRKTRFDDVHAQLGQAARHHQLLLRGHAATGRLLAIAQGGIEDADVIGRGGVGNVRVHQLDSSATAAVRR